MAERPDPTSMEGMLWNSLKVLDKATDRETVVGIPKALFLDCKGIVIINIVEAGFIFSGSVGTGIIMVRKEDGTWSPPSALGLVAGGVGFVAGASYRDLLVFLMNDATLKSYTGKVSLNIGAQANLTVGTLGRNAQGVVHASEEGVGGAVAIGFSKGAFVAAALAGGTLNPRHQVNKDFYGKEVTPEEILFGNDVEIPKDTIIPDIHELLEGLADGSSWLTSQEGKKSESQKKIENKSTADS